MSKYLISNIETYRVDSEGEVKRVIEEAKQSKEFTLTKYVSEYKERKLKGEVVDSYYKLTLTKVFNDIKDPDTTVQIKYNVSYGNFPSVDVNIIDNNEDEGVDF